MDSQQSRPNHGFTSPSLQTHLHNLATTFPAPAARKQNIACDACRTRKVKCNQIPGEDKCQHCQTKNYPCTFHVQQATSEKKRAGAVRRPRTTSNPGSSSTPELHPVLLPQSHTPSPNLTHTLPVPNQHQLQLHTQHYGQPVPQPSPHLTHSPLRLSPYPLPTPSLAPSTPTRPNHQRSTSTSRLLDYLFSPEEDAVLPAFIGGSTSAGYRAYSASINGSSSSLSTVKVDWPEELADDAFRTEFALDLVEVYFQICHTRMPLLNPTQFRSRLRLALPPANSSKLSPLPPALLAAVVAWGAKFSEHPLLVADRARNGGKCRLGNVLAKRAREVAEGEKIHRVPSPDNIVIGMLLEPMQSQNAADPDGFHGFWLSCAIRHLFELQINSRTTTSNIPEDMRGTMVFAWWMACLADAYCAVMFRRRPLILDDDYDHDFAGGDLVPPTQSLDLSMPATTHTDYLKWFGAAHSMAVIGRNMAKTLWRPVTEVEGIPLEVLEKIMADLNEWKEHYLSLVGVPNNFEADWDFVAAVSACANDAQFHALWVTLFNATEDYGIREIKDGSQSIKGEFGEHIDAVRSRIFDEALQAALRIAGLAGVLQSNGYLRLDPNVLHVPLNVGGIMLARLGRPEVSSCIAGLQQYGFAYEEAMDQAAEMQRVYNATVAVNGSAGVEPSGAGEIAHSGLHRSESSNSGNSGNSGGGGGGVDADMQNGAIIPQQALDDDQHSFDSPMMYPPV